MSVGTILGSTPLLADVGLGLLFVKSAPRRDDALSSALSFLFFAMGLMTK